MEDGGGGGSCREVAGEGGVMREEEVQGGGGDWQLKESRRAVKAVRNADRKIEDFDRKWRKSRFTVKFEAINDNGVVSPEGFKDLNMLEVYGQARAELPSCRITKDEAGLLSVSVGSEEEIGVMKSLTSFGGVKARMVTRETPYWGRISGVPLEINESDVLEVLKSCGVSEVRREKYFVSVNVEGQVVRRERQSLRIRMKFSELPPASVDIGFPERFPVTLCLSDVPQCFVCHQFNHKAEQCSRRSTPLCRNCGLGGHQAWQCPNRSRCINCGLGHNARDLKCPVMVKYLEATRLRHLNHVVVDNPGVKVDFSKEPALEEPRREVPVPTTTKRGASYSQAVRACLTREGESLCRIPGLGQPVPPKKATSKGRPKLASSANAPVERRSSRGQTEGSPEAVWRQLECQMRPLIVQFPMLEAILSMIKIVFLSSHTEKPTARSAYV